VTVTDAVDVRYCSPVIVTASVRDDSGEHWVTFVRSLGWSCECGQDSECVHEKACRQFTGR
jgi:hypothetical protein